MEKVINTNLVKLKELSEKLSKSEITGFDDKLMGRYRKLVREIKNLINAEYSETDSTELRQMASERVCQKIKLLLSKTN